MRGFRHEARDVILNRLEGGATKVRVEGGDALDTDLSTVSAKRPLAIAHRLLGDRAGLRLRTEWGRPTGGHALQGACFTPGLACPTLSAGEKGGARDKGHERNHYFKTWRIQSSRSTGGTVEATRDGPHDPTFCESAMTVCRPAGSCLAAGGQSRLDLALSRFAKRDSGGCVPVRDGHPPGQGHCHELFVDHEFWQRAEGEFLPGGRFGGRGFRHAAVILVRGGGCRGGQFSLLTSPNRHTARPDIWVRATRKTTLSCSTSARPDSRAAG